MGDPTDEQREAARALGDTLACMPFRVDSDVILAQALADAHAAGRAEALAVHYLPMCCPKCGRNRLEYDQRAHTIQCEACSVTWPDADDGASE